MSDLSQIPTEDLLKMLGGAQPSAPTAAPVESAPLAPGPFTQSAPDGRQITRPPTAAESKPMNWPGALGAGLNSMADMFSLNQANKLDAALQSATGIGGTKGDYAGNIARTQAADTAMKAINPGASFVGGSIGAYYNPLSRGLDFLVGKMLPTTLDGITGILSKYTNRAIVGGGTGAAYGAGFAQPGQESDQAIKGGAAGAVGAMGMQALADAFTPAFNALSAKNAEESAAPTLDQIKTASQNAYKQAANSGVVISPQSFGKFADELSGTLSGFDEDVTPGANKIVNMLKKKTLSGEPITLDKLDQWRSVASGASIGRDNEARLAGSITRRIDDYIDNLGAGDLVGGDVAPGTATANAQNGVDALNTARDLWRTKAKLQNISDIVETGENLNDPNWVKNQMRSIIRKPKLFNRYTPDEQDAIKDVARTGAIERIGRLVPWRAAQTAAPHVEQIGQNIRLKALQDLIARGGIAPPLAIPAPIVPSAALSGYGGYALGREID